MINISFSNKKPRKSSVKFYLRKDISPIFYTKNNSNDVYYHLYIEFVFRRKVNKCKSKYFLYVANDSYVYSFIKGFENSSLKGYNIYGVKDSVFTNEVYTIINSDTVVDFSQRKYDLLELLYIEKMHLKHLFLILNDIDEESFTLSRISEGYQNSLKFMFDYFDFTIKEFLQKELTSQISFFPSVDFQDKFVELSTNLIETLSVLNRSHPALENKDITSLSRYVKLLNFINIICERYLVRDFKVSDSKGMTMPIWYIENHSEKLKEYFYLEIEFFVRDDYTQNEIKNTFDLVQIEVNKKVQNDLILVLDCFK